MVQTRSASNSPIKKPIPAPVSSPRKTTSKPSTSKAIGEPLRLVIVPKSLSSQARFIALSNPVDRCPKRYLYCPQHGIYELTRISIPKHDPRSILFAPAEEGEGREAQRQGSVGHGYINKEAEYMTATPYDMCFALLPIVVDSSKGNLFQSLEDFLDATSEDIHDLKYVTHHSRAHLEEALESICDSVEAGDEKMCRYNQSKTLQLVLSKARRACETGLPASLEERFVTRLLEAPVLSMRREESTVSLSRNDSATEIEDNITESTPAPSDSFDSQSSAASAAPSVVFSEASIASSTTEIATLVPESRIPETVKSLQRLLTAFRFITASYIPPSISQSLLAELQSPTSGIDFTPLNDHLAHLAKLRAEAAASTSLSSFSRKRGSLEDDEEAELRADKKRKLEEEEKLRKANISRGVKNLAKVDTKGMKKMSAFFAPKAGKAKA